MLTLADHFFFFRFLFLFFALLLAFLLLSENLLQSKSKFSFNRVPIFKDSTARRELSSGFQLLREESVLNRRWDFIFIVLNLGVNAFFEDT